MPERKIGEDRAPGHDEAAKSFPLAA
jgi:hypothetical protein